MRRRRRVGLKVGRKGPRTAGRRAEVVANSLLSFLEAAFPATVVENVLRLMSQRYLAASGRLEA